MAAILHIQVVILGPRGDVVGGWTFDKPQLHIGFARLLFPFFAGISDACRKAFADGVRVSAL